MAETPQASGLVTDHRNVVIAVDGSDQSLNAFNFYVQHVHRDDNRVVLLYCPEISNITLRFLKGDTAPYSVDEWEEIMDEEKSNWKNLQEKYENLIKEKKLQNAVFEVVASQHNKPGEAIVHYAEHKQAVLVLMGTRGLGAIKRTILGSVSDYVIHHAHCPVIVCKETLK